MTLAEILSNEELRHHEFPVTKNKIFLGHAGVCALPRRVAHAISDCANGGTLGDQEEFVMHRIADARNAGAKLLNCQPDEVSLVGPTSLALSFVAAGLNFRKDDNILIYHDDYPSNVYPWLALAAKGVQVRLLNTRGLGAIRAVDVMGQVDENTRLVALASCHFISGHRLDHNAIGNFLHERNILFCLDAIQTVGAFPTPVDMLDLPRPSVTGGRPKIVAAPASELLKEYIKGLTERAERLRTQRIDPSVDNMLKITGDGRKAALDMRLVEAFAEAADSAKVAGAVSRIINVWHDSRDLRSTQLVFCDLSTPNPDRFNVYDDIRARLIEGGVPEKEIAFIHDADTDPAKMTLFTNVNAGRVRILIGSTEKMGAGTNVQRRLRALHHLDAPWRPRDIEQREGRILRQGNLNPEIEIYRYVTEGSFDAYMWQSLETKARFIQQVMSGQTSVRSAEDLEGGALTYAEIKAIASGNPAVMEKVKIDTEIRKIDQLKSAHLNQQHSIRWQIRALPQQIAEAGATLASVQADILTRDADSSDEFSMIVGNKLFSGKGAREDAANALAVAVLTWRDDLTLQPRASFRGFQIMSRD